MRPITPWKLPVVCALATVGLPLTLAILSQFVVGKAPAPAPAPASFQRDERAKLAAVDVSLNDALGRRWLQADYQANGHDAVRASVVNRYRAPLRLTFGAGLIFETPDFQSQVAVARSQTVELAPGQRLDALLPAVATRSANALRDQPYRLCPATLGSLDALFAQSELAPEVSRDAIQTAALMITENPSLAAFTKFPLLSVDPAAKPPAPTFQVNTGEILAAFDLLKDAGYARGQYAATHDPQLKIEAMLDPLAHAAALRYYRINAEQEWAYWRVELQSGDVGTRHYALYGIGRYYPEVALQMLPDWARARHLSAMYRTSAIQALAETRRPEAVSVLQELVSEFGAASELGQSARRSITYLENQQQRRNGGLPAAAPVEFRLSQADTR